MLALLHPLVLLLRATTPRQKPPSSVREDDPWWCCMALARHSAGSTKLEAPASTRLTACGPGAAWSAAIRSSRRSGFRPRAPSLALDRGCARRAAACRRLLRPRSSARCRSFRATCMPASRALRRVFERHGVAEAMFFAQASATTLEALRLARRASAHASCRSRRCRLSGCRACASSPSSKMNPRPVRTPRPDRAVPRRRRGARRRRGPAPHQRRLRPAARGRLPGADWLERCCAVGKAASARRRCCSERWRDAVSDRQGVWSWRRRLPRQAPSSSWLIAGAHPHRCWCGAAEGRGAAAARGRG